MKKTIAEGYTRKALTVILYTIIIAFIVPSVSANWWRFGWGKHNPAISLVGFNNSTEPERGYGYLTEAAYTSGWGYRSLTPSNLTSKKGILIGNGDNLQLTIGSKLSQNVHENFSSYQGSSLLWIRPNFNYDDDANTHYLWMLDSGTNAKFSLYYDGSDDLFHFAIDATGTDMDLTASENGAATSDFTAGAWLYVVATWDFLNDSYQLQIGENGSAIGAKQTDATAKTAPTIDTGDVIYIGQDSTPSNRFNGVLRYRFLNTVISDTDITSLYGTLGAGNVDDWVATLDTTRIDLFTDSDTDAVFQHRGQEVTSTQSAVTDAVTVAQAVGSRSWTDNDRVVIYDGTGYKVEGLLASTPATTDTTLDVDDGTGSAVTDIEKVGVYATLDGSTQYFDTSPTGLDLAADDGAGAGSYSMAAWIKTSSTNGMVVVKDTATSNGIYLLIDGSGYAHAKIFNTAAGAFIEQASSITVNDGKWHHVAMTYDDGASKTLTVYVDGYSKGSTTTTSGTKDTGAGTLYIGQHVNGSLRFNGSLRDVGVWAGTALTAANVLSLAIGPLTEIASPSSWWKMTDAASATTLNDATAGNNNDLTLVGGTTTNYGTHSRTQSAFISKNLIADAGMENGGIGIRDADYLTPTVSKDSTIVKFDTQSLKITNASAAQGYITHNVTAAAGENYLWHSWFRTPATPVQGNSPVRLDNAATGTIPISNLESSGTASANTWYEVEFVYKASDTSLTVDLNTGSGTNGESAYHDQLQLLPNLVDDGGMEGTLTDAWTQETNATMAADTSERSGAQEMKITAAAANVGATQAITLVSGKYYTVSGWARATSGDTAQIVMDKGDGTTITVGSVTATSYTRISNTFKSTGTSGNIYLRAVANGDIVWFDDVAVIRLDQDDPSVTGTATPASDTNSFRIGKYNDTDGSFEVKGGATLEYPASSNVEHEEGSLSFKVYPNGWNGADSVKHKLFALQGHPDELIVIDKTAANNLEFYYMGTYGIPRLLRYAVAGTKLPANTWAEIYIDWKDGNPPETELYLNNTSVGTVVSSPGYYGTWHEGINQADARFDDVFTFDRKLSQSERTQLYILAHRARFRMFGGGWGLW